MVGNRFREDANLEGERAHARALHNFGNEKSSRRISPVRTEHIPAVLTSHARVGPCRALRPS